MSLYLKREVLIDQQTLLIDEGRLFVIDEDSTLENTETISVSLTTTRKTSINYFFKVDSGLTEWEIITGASFTGGTAIIAKNPNLLSTISLGVTSLKDAALTNGTVFLDGKLGTSSGERQADDLGSSQHLVIPAASTVTFRLTSQVNGNLSTISLTILEQ